MWKPFSVARCNVHRSPNLGDDPLCHRPFRCPGLRCCDINGFFNRIRPIAWEVWCWVLHSHVSIPTALYSPLLTPAIVRPALARWSYRWEVLMVDKKVLPGAPWRYATSDLLFPWEDLSSLHPWKHLLLSWQKPNRCHPEEVGMGVYVVLYCGTVHIQQPREEIRRCTSLTWLYLWDGRSPPTVGLSSSS